MSSVRQSWTDERLDDLQSGMHREFDQVRAEARGHRAEAKAETRELRTEMNARFAEMNARFDGLQRTMVVGFGSIVASVVGAIFVNAL